MTCVNTARFIASPLRGEAARRADEGGIDINHGKTPLPLPLTRTLMLSMEVACVNRTTLVPSLGGADFRKGDVERKRASP